MEESREYYIEKFKAAREKREYFLYSKNVEEMTLEELKDEYANMQNYLSDARTHDAQG